MDFDFTEDQISLRDAVALPALHGGVSATLTRTATRAWWRPVVATAVLIGAIGVAARSLRSVQTADADSSQLTLPSPVALDTTRILVLPYEFAAAEGARLAGPDRFPNAIARWHGITLVGLPGSAAAESGAPRSPSQVAALAHSLNAGRCIRRRVTVTGNQFVIHAALFDPARFQKVDEQTITVTGSAPPPDSVLRELADRLLLARVPDSLRTGPWVGTVSLPALAEFARGIGPLDSLELSAADSAFRIASTLDTTYARAALWLAMVRVWQDSPRETWAPYVSRAQLGRSSLSPGDARLLPILLRLLSGDSAHACGIWQQLAKQDDADLVAWFSAARCMLADSVVVRDARSASGWRFRSSLWGAARKLEHALALNPSVGVTFASPWSRSLASLLLVYSDGVRAGTAPADSSRFEASAVWDLAGDSVRLVPYRLGSEPVISPQLHARSVTYLRDQLTRLTRQYARFFGRDDTGIAISYAREATGRGDPIAEARSGFTNANDGRTRLRTAIPFAWLLTKHSLPDSVPLIESVRVLADSVLRANPAPAPREAAALTSLAVLLGRFDLARTLIRRSSDPSIRPEALDAQLELFTPTRIAPGRVDTAAVRRTLARLSADNRRHRLPGIPPTTLMREADIRLVLADTTGASQRLASLLDSLPELDVESLRSPIEMAALMRSIATYTALGSRSEADRRQTTRWALALRTLWTDADRSLQPLVDRLASTATQSSPPK